MSDPDQDVRHSILVVDDEDDLRHLVGRVLTDAGFEVREAIDGGGALASIRKHRPDLVLLDLMMPVMDGWGVLKRLQEIENPPAVVILTARGDEHAFTRCVQAGVAGYIAKPFQLSELVNTCRKVLSLSLSEPPQASDRRRLPRRDLMVKVRVVSDQAIPVALGELINISHGGAQVNLVGSLEPGSRVRVTLHIAAGTEGLKFEGRIQWRAAATDGFAHGVEFVDLDDETRRRLETLLRPAA